MSWKNFGRIWSQTAPRSGFCPHFDVLEDRRLLTTLLDGYVETPVAAGLSQPTGFEFAPDGRIFITQKSGAIRVVKNDQLLSTPFLSLNVDSTVERGLLGIAFDPQFTTNSYVYAYYTVPGSPAHNRVSRFTANGDAVVPGSELPILDLDPLSDKPIHNGGGIHFGPDGKLYVGVGENGVGSNAQSLTNLLGKMLRLNSDGSIPSDNPFYQTATGQNRAIWALGLRNPFSFAFQPGVGTMFINDVGQADWEEINDGIAGSNYGWPATEGPTSNPSFREPINAYEHGPNDVFGSAITDGTFYNPAQSQFPASAIGDYFFSDFSRSWIHQLDPRTGVVTDFATGLAPLPVGLGVDHAGSLYYIAIGYGADTGVLNKIQYTGSQPVVPIPNSPYARVLFNAIFQREPEPAALSSLSLALAQGANPQQVALALVTSPERRAKAVVTAYQSLLGRVPDALEYASNLNRLSSGSSQENLRATLLSSAEYAARHGGTPQRVVRSIYQDLFGRLPRRTELNQGARRVASGTTGSLVARLIASNEARSRLIVNAYASDLQRRPTSLEVRATLTQLSRGVSLEQAEADILSGREFIARSGGL
ncbi:PQQ-dependent sugar dehydrogenase [Singulisphaera sp. Ch08]|uniref:PQQ-dependent sugar dehydrogenase n=1 Tax=Singulisphaera sp. Ch08 TaxID=3120278 RepID=A0AAU7C7L8_9BACT